MHKSIRNWRNSVGPLTCLTDTCGLVDVSVFVEFPFGKYLYVSILMAASVIWFAHVFMWWISCASPCSNFAHLVRWLTVLYFGINSMCKSFRNLETSVGPLTCITDLWFGWCVSFCWICIWKILIHKHDYGSKCDMIYTSIFVMNYMCKYLF